MHRSASEIEVLLRKHGFSLTPQRRAIARCLGERGGHWTAAELLERLSGECPMAIRATVYSTLALLRELGALAAVAVPGGELRFDADPEPHQHFSCLRCGRLEDVPDGHFPISIPDRPAPRFEVHRFHLVAEGFCAACCSEALADPAA